MKSSRTYCLVTGYFILLGGLAAVQPTPLLAADQPLPSTIEFNRDIRPILSDNCFQCHGPDRNKRKADLRLDVQEGALADLGGRYALVPGKPEKSELYYRITAKEDAQRMPPTRSGKQLTSHQVQLLRRWIEQGAKWQQHWSFIPPKRSALPQTRNTRWMRNAIDAFILARLEQDGLTPSTEADRVALLRRVTLDLTGLPPTPAEVDALLADESPDAYEKVVDRLLAAPRFGERLAVEWLDAARYADTNGYQSDGERSMWRWRDWVIDAFNKNRPFDRFTVEQIAGDLLPNPTLDQLIATGFNRNHRGNGEGGIIPEEYAVEYVVDRVDTTTTVWLGLTMGCARCHDHKFDPLKQKEFYQVFAYFNNVPERGKAVKFGNSPPMIKAPTTEQQRQLKQLQAKVSLAEAKFAALQPELDRAQIKWEKKLDTTRPIPWTLTRGLLAHYTLDGDIRETSGKVKAGKVMDGSLTYMPGRVGQAGVFDGKGFVEAGDVGNFGFYDKFTLAAWVYPQGPRGGIILSRMTDTARSEGYSLHLEKGKLQVNLVKRWLDDSLRVETEQPLEPDRWHHVLATYDGSRVVGGIKVYVNGQLQKLKVNLDDLNQSFESKEPFRIGAGGGKENRFQGSIDDVRVYSYPLSAREVAIVAATEPINAIVSLPADRRTQGQTWKLLSYYLEQHAPKHIQRAYQQLLSLYKERSQLIESFPTTMVMEEMPTPRDTFVLLRGQYDKPGEKVAPGIPAVLPPLPRGVSNNRLGFAQWLVHPTNPLTARVIVNRYWQLLFGTGLVRTTEDFGVQGEWPSHPELLDWLATEFMRSGWDIKAILKTIVTSATYRQSSRMTKAMMQKDPDNRLLGRGPRLRLSAEMIRDQALFASGLLVENRGGPSVKPYQPRGLWEEVSGTNYKRDKGEGLYRRGLYTYWKRTVAPPSMMTFDASSRESCVVRQTRTNTPLQALTLMNDVTYVEASRVLAQRVLMEAGKTPQERIVLAFRLLTARSPRPLELQILVNGFHRHLTHYREDREAALKLITMGDSPRNPMLDVSELAAYTAVTGLILNLDEVITKE